MTVEELIQQLEEIQRKRGVGVPIKVYVEGSVTLDQIYEDGLESIAPFIILQTA